MKVLIEFGNSAKKVNLEEEISLEKLLNTVTSIFNLEAERVKLQVFDKDFNAFSDFEDIREIKDLCRIKVIDKLGSFQEMIEEAQPILPTNDSTNLRRKSWNSSNFSISIHSFSLIAQEELSSASNHYAADNQKLHKASYKLKREIIDILS